MDMRLFKRLIVLGLIIAMTVAMASATTIKLGSIKPITGGDAGEGLDLSGDIVCAFNLGGKAQTVQGVTFVAASRAAPPAGITTTASSEYNYGATVDYGTSTDDNALEAIATTVWYAGNWTFDLAVVPGKQYQLQLIIQEAYTDFQGAPNRNFDIWIETVSPATMTLAVDDLVLGTLTTASRGLVYTYTFTASDSSILVALADSRAGADGNCVLNAVTLEKLSGVPQPDDAGKDQATAAPVDWKSMMTVAETKRDANGDLLPLQSYDETIRQGMSFLMDDHLKWFKGPKETITDENGNVQMPWVYYSNLQQNGAPFPKSVDRFVSYPAFHHSLLIKTFIGYSKYSGDGRALKEAVKLADWDIAHSTPGDWAYGNLPYSTYQEKKPGGFRDKTGLMPDKAAIMALAYIDLYKATSKPRFLKAAQAIAQTLADRQRPNSFAPNVTGHGSGW